MTENLIQKAAENNKPAVKQQNSVNAMLNSILDGEGMRKRFDDLLGDRAAQFISSIITLANSDSNLQKAAMEAPMTVIQSALKAATFDLPIDPSLGFAYIVPFRNSKANRMEASFIIGYKGMIQLCLRTGAYARVPDAIDVREGELISYDRLTGDCEFKWVEDEEERNKLPIIGYVGYFRLKNGAEKTIYMSRKQIEAHEKKNRKGNYMGRGWQDDFNAMAIKTVIRRLVGRYGLMSITYQNGSPEIVKAATEVMNDEEPYDTIPADYQIDQDTGEIVKEEQKHE